MPTTRSQAFNTRPGTCKWFNVKAGYGFVTCTVTGRDFFVHRSHIATPNPCHTKPSIEKDEQVSFTLALGPKGEEARDVSGPEGATLKGSRHARKKGKKTKKVHGYPRDSHWPAATKVDIIVSAASKLSGTDRSNSCWT